MALPWVSLWAFVRIATNARALRHPLSPQQALAIVSADSDFARFPDVERINPL